MSNTPKRTPLYHLHMKYDAKMMEFSGWEMPLQYPSGIVAEHRQCREKAALFDVSHMGQIMLSGSDVAKKLETLVPSALQELPKGKARYTFFTNPQGGIMDDLIVSNTGDHLFAVVNAAMRNQDIAHMAANLPQVKIVELHDQALVAIQGPESEKVVGNLCPTAVNMKFMETTSVEILGTDCRISRLGYTGEDGYEISIPGDKATEITRALLAQDDCKMAGLGARDSLRLEAGLCLYGNDIDTEISPVEATLTWAIQRRRQQQRGFPGAERILAEITEGTKRTLVGIKPEGRLVARQGTEIYTKSDQKIGSVTSGGFSPTLNGPIAMGYVETPFSQVGTKVILNIRGRPYAAKVTALPFVQHNYKR